MLKVKYLYYVLLFVGLFVATFYIVKATNPYFFRSSAISKIIPFQFEDQYGRIITEQNLKGKVVISEFFFTSCKNVCPIMNQSLKEVYDKYKGHSDFLILSHTCDPHTDSVARLREYAASWGVQDSTWLFLTGTAKNLYQAARLIYKIDDRNQAVDSSYNFMHTQLWAVVNKQGEVVKIVDALDDNELASLKNLVEELI